jgi:hypothetical protein
MSLSKTNLQKQGGMMYDPMENHPECIDPPWFQELVRRAFDREAQRQLSTGVSSDEALDRAMWYVFDLRNNLTELYHAGKVEDQE